MTLYVAYLRDPDGNKLCALHLTGEPRSIVTIETVSESKSFGGIQGVYRHESTSTGTPMSFAVYVPEHTAGAKLPVLWWLSGLTCTACERDGKGRVPERPAPSSA
jgi:hypothetical protein